MNTTEFVLLHIVWKCYILFVLPMQARLRRLYGAWVLCVYPSLYTLLNHRAEFNQICYMTFPCGKGVRKQRTLFFPSVRLFFHMSVAPPSPKPGLQNHWTEFNQTYPGGNESNIIFLSVRPSRYLFLKHWVEFNQICYMTSPRGNHW